ncbi:MAG: hypothetical protein E7052_06075 [Lentisphaerae bacterium]|nr:hypothetical protein [Lentisphaerota bacterium]
MKKICSGKLMLQVSKLGVLAAVALLELSVAAGDFKLTADGNFGKISYKNAPFIESVTTRVLKSVYFAADAQKSMADLPGGGQVFNVWSQNPASLFRQEVAVYPDSSGRDVVEITYMAENPARKGYRGKSMEVTLPYSFFEGASYRAYTINSRQVKEIKGVFDAKLPDGALGKTPIRFLAIEKGDTKLIFDLNPIGPGDYMNNYRQSAVRGIWDVVRRGNKLVFVQKTSLPEFGGVTGTKMRIMPGTFEDYDKLHALKMFHYTMSFTPQKLYSFGAAKTGAAYSKKDLAAFSAADHAGWVSDTAQLQARAFSPEGAYYGNVYGRNGKFKFDNLANGIYIVTVGAGNFGKLKNQFEIFCNRDSMTGKPISVPEQYGMTFSQAVQVKNNVIELDFKGDFIVSVIGGQFLMADGEDFSIMRPFWKSNGFEPSVLFRNDLWSKPGRFEPAVEKFFMPVPGQECAAPLKKPSRTVSLPAINEQTKWRFGAKTIAFGGYTWNEYKDDPEGLELHLDNLVKLKYNTIMVGGLHARHAYKGHEKRMLDELEKVAVAAHKRNLKIIDHHDATLLWNTDSGFRVMAERLSETERDIRHGLPNHRFCIMNRKFVDTYTEYCSELVRRGMDGLQLDEVNFFSHGCVCADCRKKFHEDTNWYLPVNECDPALNTHTNKLFQVWLEWKLVRETDFFINLRSKLSKINPNVSFMQYTTHYGLTASRLRQSNSARDLEEYARAIDWFGTEVMTRNPYKSVRGTIPMRKAFNLLKFAYGTPIWALFYNNNWDVRYMSYAVCNMLAQQPMISYMTCPAGKTDFQNFTKHPDNMDPVTAVPQAKIALLFSRSSRDFNRLVGFEPELFGLAQTLEEMHIPYQIIGEVSLKPEVLKQFDVVSLGSSGCLSEEQAAAIKEYAQNGGTVWLCNITGIFDQYGNFRKEWLFKDVFGFNVHNSPLRNITEFETADGKIVTMQNPVTYFTTKPTIRGASPSGSAITPIGKFPLWIEKSWGKGKFIYQPMQLAGSLYALEGAPGRKWNFTRDDALADFMHRLLRERLSKSSCWTTDAPRKVYTTLYREPERYLVHFLNMTGSAIRKGEVMDHTVPADAYPALKNPVSFQLPVNDMPVKQVYAISPDFAGRKALQFTNKDNVINVTVPPELIKVYTIVILDSK